MDVVSLDFSMAFDAVAHKFYLNIGKHTVTLQVVRTRCPERWRFSPWEISVSCLGMVLGNLLSVSLLEQGLEQMTSRGSNLNNFVMLKCTVR